MSKISSLVEQKKLQNNLNSIIEWSKSNNMTLNTTKFEFLSFKLFRKNNTDFNLLNELPFQNSIKSYSADNNLLFPSSSVRDLGVIFDANLEWKNHYTKLYRSSKQITGWILNTFFSRDKHTMLTLFNSLVRSRLEFGCEVWNPYLKKDILLIEQIQRSFTHRIKEVKDLDYWNRLKSLNLLSLQRRRERSILLHVWKIVNGVYPNSIDLNLKLHKRSNSLKAVLRPLPKTRGKLLSIFENSFIINAPKLWNVLPATLTQTKSLNCFVHKLDLFLSEVPDEPPLPGYPCKNNNSLIEQCSQLCL